MGRKSVRLDRREEIAAAFEACARRYGLAGTSLRRVASELGVTQPLLLHHFGSRQALIEVVTETVLARYAEGAVKALGNLDTNGGAESLLEFLFGGSYTKVAMQDDAMFAELTAQANRDRRARALLHEMYSGLERDLARHLRRAFPQVAARECRRVAYALMCLVESNEAFRRVGLTGERSRHCLEAGRALVATLGRKPRERE